MPLTYCTLTGVDDLTPLIELAVVSDLYPHVEWGFLYSPKRQGTPGRYPSVARLQRALRELPAYARVALHVTGDGVAQLLEGEAVVSDLLSLLQARRGRIQLNFNAASGEVDLARLRAFIVAHPEAIFITQHNHGNVAVTDALAGLPNHAILFDASLGRGLSPEAWPLARGSAPCGYAGGLGPETLERALPRIYEAARGADFWIDMEGRLRDRHDRFDMHAARVCLDIVSFEMTQRLHLRPQPPRRRQCEMLDLVESGLAREAATEHEFEAMLAQLVHAVRDVADPHVRAVRRRAEDLLDRKARPAGLGLDDVISPPAVIARRTAFR